MTRHEYAHLDVFTDRPFGGNQLAVFADAWGVSDADMQAIAKELNLPETVFLRMGAVRKASDREQERGQR